MTSMRTIAILVSAATLTFAAGTKDFSKTVPLDANGRFSLETYKGSIRISAWDQPQAEIRAHIVEDTGFHAMSVDDVDIRVDAFAGSVRVKSDYHHHWGWNEGNSPEVHYTIRIPRGASLTVEDYKSESDITGVQGDVEFHTYKGIARLEGLQRGLRLKTYRGDIRVGFARFSSGAQIETYRGTIDLSLPKSSAFEINAKLERHADFECEFPRTVRTSRQERDFRSTINGGGPELRLNSYRGSIRVRAT
jgi:hypothetical protein